jgi:hypothetical protein
VDEARSTRSWSVDIPLKDSRRVVWRDDCSRLATVLGDLCHQLIVVAGH